LNPILENRLKVFSAGQSGSAMRAMNGQTQVSIVLASRIRAVCHWPSISPKYRFFHEGGRRKGMAVIRVRHYRAQTGRVGLAARQCLADSLSWGPGAPFDGTGVPFHNLHLISAKASDGAVRRSEESASMPMFSFTCRRAHGFYRVRRWQPWNNVCHRD